MLFTRPPRAAEDIRSFCARFNEGLRVEYKASLDDAVRRALPKVVSSFANSRGGVIVLGVNAVNGVPQPPIEGFEPAAREEIPLTIENICLENLHPPVFPRIIEVPGDASGSKFFVVEVDESAEAPHAIENSTKVYVRTGNAANPYELAQVETIIALLRRREDPTSRRRDLVASVHINGIDAQAPQMEIVICPVFPMAPLCPVEDCWEFLRTAVYQATNSRFFNFEGLRRVENGVTAILPGRRYAGAECAEVNCYGLVASAKQLATASRQPGLNEPYLIFADVLNSWVKIYMCSAAFFERTGFKGAVVIQIKLKNMMGQRLPFIGFEGRSLEEFRSFDQTVTASHVLSAETLGAQVETVTHQLLDQLCWAVWQGSEYFPSQTLNNEITAVLRQLRAIH
jgi:hypothetical protein